jgi:hypothetical protein
MNVTITLTVEEANYVLAALGARPFVEVADLITKVKAQAESQLSPKPTVPDED